MNPRARRPAAPRPLTRRGCRSASAAPGRQEDVPASVRPTYPRRPGPPRMRHCPDLLQTLAPRPSGRGGTDGPPGEARTPVARPARHVPASSDDPTLQNWPTPKLLTRPAEEEMGGRRKRDVRPDR